MNIFLKLIIPLFSIMAISCSQSKKSEKLIESDIGKSNQLDFNLDETESFDPYFRVEICCFRSN